MLLIFALCCIPCVIGTNPNIRQTDKGITWSNAGLECGDSGLENEDAVMKMSNIPVGKKFWIGTATYKSLTDWMEFIGCFNIHRVDTQVYHVNSLAHCKIHCGTHQYIGYKPKYETCICLHYWRSYDAVNMQQCNTGTSFNVYKDFNRKLDNDDGNGKCVLLICNKGSYEQITSRFTQESCNRDRSVVGICDKSSTHIYEQNYATSKDHCLGENKLLSSSSYCENTNKPSIGSYVWTNIFREEFEVNLTKHETKSQLINCFSGTLYANDSETKLATRNENCSQHLNWFLCKSNDSSFETTYTSLQLTSRSSTLSFSGQSIISVDVITTNAQATHMNNTTKAGIKQEAKGNPTSEFPLGDICIIPKRHTLDRNFIFVPEELFLRKRLTSNTCIQQCAKSQIKCQGAVVGGGLSMVVVVALISLLIVCKIRSCGIFKASNSKEQNVMFSKNTYDDSNITVAINSVTTSSSPTYGLASPVQINSNTYAVVNKIKKTEASSNDVDTYTDSSYGEYDRLNDVHKRQIQTQENLYDSNAGRRNENDPTYDSSDIGERKRYTHVNEDDLYDHSFTFTHNGEYLRHEYCQE